MNKVFLMGRLGRDPESRYTSSGKHVANVSIAVDVGWGEKKQTVWMPLVCWEQKADVLVEHFHKGSRILVEGHLTERSWEQEGQKRSRIETVVDQLHFVDPKRERDEEEGFAPPPRNPASPIRGMADLDDDIPF